MRCRYELLAGANLHYPRSVKCGGWKLSFDPRDGGFSPGVDMVVGGGVGWGGDDNSLCTCTHGWCYATPCFLQLHTWSVLRNTKGWGGVGDNSLCTCTHGWCYATSCSLHLHTWSMLRNIMFLALAHMVGATQHHVSCTCTHGRCYATSCFLHLHTRSVLRNIMFWIKIAFICSDVW